MHLLGRAVHVGLAAVLAAVVVVAVVHPLNSWFVFRPPVVLVGAVVGLALLLAVGEAGRRRPGRVVTGAAVAWVLGSLQAVASLAPYGWDAGGVQRRAEALVAGTLGGDQLTYLAWYPNNLPLLAAEAATIRLGHLFGLPAMASLFVGNLVLYAVLLVAVGRTCVVLGRASHVWPAQLLVLVLIGLSPALVVPYSDLPAATLSAVAVLGGAMALRTTRSRALALTVLAAVALGVAVALKPFAGCLAVAATIVALAALRHTPHRRVLLTATVTGLATLALTVAGVGAAARLTTGLDDARLAAVAEPFPPEHFLAMGTFDSREDSPVRRWGSFRQAQVDATAAMDPQTRREHLRTQVRDQVEERGPAGNARFFGAKAAWVWGDGTFWAQGEGPDSTALGYHRGGPLARVAEVTRAPGALYPVKASLVQGLWLATLGLLVVGLLRTRPTALTTTLALALGGLTLYLTMFEARPRYLVAFLPLVVVLLATTRTRGITPAPRSPVSR